MSDPPGRRVSLFLACAITMAAAVGCATQSEGGERTDPVGDGTGAVAAGEELYAATCAVCHGASAEGTNVGPPFLHEVYVPSHHGDAAFLTAVRNGVAPHHWDFGAMPPIGGLSDQDVADITAWVRAQQREAGIVD